MRTRTPAALSLVAALFCSCAVSPSSRFPEAGAPTGGFVLPGAPVPAPCDAAPAADPQDETGPRFRTFSLRGGGQFVADFSSELRLDSERLGRGTSISLEKDLGFDSSTRFARFDAGWRFNRWHALEASYFSFARTATRVSEKDITWGPIEIPAGSGVAARLSVDTLKAAYRYTVLADGDWEIGAALGVHATRLGAGLGTVSGSAELDYAVTVPLPVLGLRATWQLAPRVAVQGLVDCFYLELSGLGGVGDALDDLTGANRMKGYLVDVLLSLEYDLLDNVGVGIGGNWFQLDVAAGNEFVELSADYSFVGGLVFLSVSF